ncbi:hypothetical protein C2G38_2200409 [Gigaspora rosea]|uniref:Uncharacterized protein n=1 Tax=Gigaspora rosea TaxID=44941 RepID=A0A397UYC1_9GLOM|nr:hypothetical protein C2G38_2200409 [Gigaspora rosea]
MIYRNDYPYFSVIQVDSNEDSPIRNTDNDQYKEFIIWCDIGGPVMSFVSPQDFNFVVLHGIHVAGGAGFSASHPIDKIFETLEDSSYIDVLKELVLYLGKIHRNILFHMIYSTLNLTSAPFVLYLELMPEYK